MDGWAWWYRYLHPWYWLNGSILARIDSSCSWHWWRRLTSGDGWAIATGILSPTCPYGALRHRADVSEMVWNGSDGTNYPLMAY